MAKQMRRIKMKIYKIDWEKAEKLKPNAKLEFMFEMFKFKFKDLEINEIQYLELKSYFKEIFIEND